MPESPIIEIAYASIFIELCKLQPSNMPQVLALATELIFEKLDHMTKDRIQTNQISPVLYLLMKNMFSLKILGKPSAERFSNWFAHHLSNFQFRWSWDEWADCLTQEFSLIF